MSHGEMNNRIAHLEVSARNKDYIPILYTTISSPHTTDVAFKDELQYKVVLLRRTGLKICPASTWFDWNSYFHQNWAV